MPRDYDTITLDSWSGGTQWVAFTSEVTVWVYDNPDPQIIEREIIRYVDRPVYIEKEVIVEKPVYVIKDNVFNNSQLTINPEGIMVDQSGITILGGVDFYSGTSISISTKQQPNIREIKIMDYTSLGFILAVMIICIVTVKFVLPHVTLKNVMKAIVRLIVWPFKKAYQAVNKEWKEANKVPKLVGKK